MKCSYSAVVLLFLSSTWLRDERLSQFHMAGSGEKIQIAGCLLLILLNTHTHDKPRRFLLPRLRRLSFPFLILVIHMQECSDLSLSPALGGKHCGERPQAGQTEHERGAITLLMQSGGETMTTGRSDAAERRSGCATTTTQASSASVCLLSQAEIVKRLSAICAQIIPFLSQEVRVTTSRTHTHTDTKNKTKQAGCIQTVDREELSHLPTTRGKFKGSFI